jgi:hypothetical protein
MTNACGGLSCATSAYRLPNAGAAFQAEWGLNRLSAAAVTMFHWLVPKMRQALTFSATIQQDHRNMRTLAVISILALLTISGAAYTDQVLTSDQQTTQNAN